MILKISTEKRGYNWGVACVANASFLLNEIDIERVRYHFSPARVPIVTSRNAIDFNVIKGTLVKCDTGSMCDDRRFIVIIGFIMLCKNEVMNLLPWSTAYALLRVYFLVFISFVASQLGK